MAKQVWAITTCRVSTPEQMENNSLYRQAEATLRAAQELQAFIPEDGQWSGNVSSKAGTNTNRKDIKEMLDYCRKHPQVKYLIVHEVDRFMRSIDELFHFEVEFRLLGVKVWYSSQPELNTDDVHAKLLKALEAFKGEGSNVERHKKSIDGQTTALIQGRYPFSPKPGYKKGSETGVQEMHPLRGPALQRILIILVNKLVTPTQALVGLNASEFMDGHAPYKMDKFRKIVTDPFYAGIVEINKQVKVRNENGLHQPLITKAQHEELVRIMDAKKKTQIGPRKNGNSKYPASNITICVYCLGRQYGRYVGFDHSNGKPNGPTYEKYRCRSCGNYMTREELHNEIKREFKQNPVTNIGQERLLNALNIVWKRKEVEALNDANRLRHRISNLAHGIAEQVEAVTDPSNRTIREEILSAIEKKKQELADHEGQLYELNNKASENQVHFLRYAYSFVENIGEKFLEESVSKENRLRCKQLVFPAGFYVGDKNKVYTPEKSILITLLPKKKDAEASMNSRLVRVKGL